MIKPIYQSQNVLMDMLYWIVIHIFHKELNNVYHIGIILVYHMVVILIVWAWEHNVSLKVVGCIFVHKQDVVELIQCLEYLLMCYIILLCYYSFFSLHSFYILLNEGRLS